MRVSSRSRIWEGRESGQSLRDGVPLLGTGTLESQAVGGGGLFPPALPSIGKTWAQAPLPGPQEIEEVAMSQAPPLAEPEPEPGPGPGPALVSPFLIAEVEDLVRQLVHEKQKCIEYQEAQHGLSQKQGALNRQAILLPKRMAMLLSEQLTSIAVEQEILKRSMDELKHLSMGACSNHNHLQMKLLEKAQYLPDGLRDALLQRL